MPEVLSAAGITNLSTSQMPNVSEGSDVTGTTHTVGDSDSGYCRECTNVSGCELTFPDTLTAGKSGSFLRPSGAGAITWTASGSMAVSVVSSVAGATSSGDAPAYVHWHCPETNKVNLSGDLA